MTAARNLFSFPLDGYCGAIGVKIHMEVVHKHTAIKHSANITVLNYDITFGKYNVIGICTN
jgi:hypothetical protein